MCIVNSQSACNACRHNACSIASHLPQSASSLEPLCFIPGHRNRQHNRIFVQRVAGIEGSADLTRDHAVLASRLGARDLAAVQGVFGKPLRSLHLLLPLTQPTQREESVRCVDCTNKVRSLSRTDNEWLDYLTVCSDGNVLAAGQL